MSKIFETYKTAHKDGTTGVHPIKTTITEEYVQSKLYLSDEIYRNDVGSIETYYRLHSKEPHNNTMALAYDVYCPKCHRAMRLLTDNLDYHTLGYYECKHCNNKGGLK